MVQFPSGQERPDGPPAGVTAETIAAKLLELEPKKLALFARLQRATKGDGTVERVCKEEGIGAPALSVRNRKIFDLIGVGESNFKGRKELIRSALDLADQKHTAPVTEHVGAAVEAPESDNSAAAAAPSVDETAGATNSEETTTAPASSAVVPAAPTSPEPVKNGHSNGQHTYPFALPVRIALEHLGPITDFDIASVQLGATHAKERQELLAEKQAQGMQVAELLLHPDWPSSQLVFVKRV